MTAQSWIPIDFKDKSTIVKPNTTIRLLCNIPNERGNLVVEFHNILGNWFAYHHTDVEIENLKINRPHKWEEWKSEILKFEKDQKRKELSIERFNELFELV